MAFISKDSRDGTLYEYYIGKDGKRKRRSLRVKSFSPLLFDFRDKVLEYAKAFHSFGTFQLYETTFKYFCELIGNVPIDSITPLQIESFKISRLNSVTPSRVNIYLRNLKASFNHAISWGLLTNNPANGIKKLREYQVERKIFKPDEIEKLLAVVDYEPLYKLIVVAFYTGCRLSELLHLQYCDIDWIEKSLIIRNKESFTTKSGKVRRIPISSKIPIEWLQSEKQQDYIFKNCKGKRNKKDYMGQLMREYTKKAGLPKGLTFHCLRHTFITNLLRKGVSIYIVKKLAGHADIKTTELYAHLVTDDLKEAVNCL